MFWVVAFLLGVWFASAGAASPKKDDNQPNSQAPIYVVMDGKSGAVLTEKSATKPFDTGDMAKLMTAEVVFNALTQQTITLDTAYQISERAWQRGQGGSMFLLLGSRVRVEDLLRGITTISADDAAIALAEGLAGSEDNFVRLMNERAQLIDLKNYSFSSSTGRGAAEQHITARDIARLSWHLATRYPAYYPLYRERSLTWAKIEQLNRNPLLARYPSIDGLKAARGTPSGFALVASAHRDDKHLIVVVAGLENSQEAATEAQRLLDWGFTYFAHRQLFPAGKRLASATVFGGVASDVPLVTHEPVEILWREGSQDRLSMAVDYRGPLSAPVTTGIAVGTLKIMRNSVLILEIPIYTDENVGEGSLQQKAASAAQELSGRAFRGLWQIALGLKQKKL